MRHLIMLMAALLLIPAQAHAADYLGEHITYMHGDAELEGYWVASHCKTDKPNPVVLIVHQWKGITDHEKTQADKLAKECYNAFAVDMYGKGIRPETNEAAGEQASLYKNNPALARDRLQTSLAFAREKAGTTKAAILGYCFGGTMALELARSGADIAAAVSFHGGLASKEPAAEEGQVKAAILAHHGDADPHVPAAEVQGFLNEMRAVKADWAFARYADAVHAFTQKEAGDDPSKGAAYNKAAARRSWATTLDFLELIFFNKE